MNDFTTELPLQWSGTITTRYPTSFTVQSNGSSLSCGLAAALLRQPTDPLVVGDQVRVQTHPDGSHVIVERLPRRNHIARRAAVPMPGAHAHQQVIAANLDQVIPVFAAAQPAPKWNLLDRYLAAIESAGLESGAAGPESGADGPEALIVLTKNDLATGAVQAEIAAAAAEYRRIGYPVLQVSAQSGEGLDELRVALQDRVSVLLGKSGVGKTTLLNALQPGLGLRVSTVSQATGKGRHTTTHLQLFPLAGGGAIIDTPGVREFGLWDVDPAALDECFLEMRPYLGQCRFGLDCAHDEEPGCAVRRAVLDGDISPRRYQSYLRLRAEA